ncbi:hypothetical protein [Candidatus Formimonas warabiya]|uniref:AdoMet activation domain-containing protein n=1 Tax=Formimonas warabiya TaxID=1761012 RepID=A0A3G1KZP3_FORW1|nr:hypothetical protein [Candidatus Formimonas warabiya]ATW27705.1 hypothetical protein DCMF_25755 [Candidatus Formimonas warabiya]
MIEQGMKINVSLEELLRVHGVTKSDRPINPHILENYERLLEEAMDVISPRYIYREIRPSEMREEQTVLETGHTVDARIFAKMMQGAEKIIFMCCTIGPELEDKIKEYKNAGAPAKAYVLDSIGSLATDKLAQEGCKMVEDMAQSLGQITTIPLSPGYMNWPLKDQQIFFEILEPQKVGVRLSDTFIMSPLKSTTQAIGVGSNLKEKHGATNCDYCALKERCNFRKARAV